MNKRGLSSVSEPFTGYEKSKAGRKKKPSEKRGVEKKENSFLCWAGEYQQLYEQWRAQALAGDGVQLFCDWGMALFSPEYKGGCGRLFMVSRRRASVKAGTFSLGRLLLDLGVVQKGFKELRSAYANKQEEVNVC
jgi:hypothetical protein